MPRLPSIPKTMLCHLVGADTGDFNMHNQFYLSYSGTLSQADLGTFISGIMTAWTTHMAGCFHTQFKLEEIDVADLSSDTAPVDVLIPTTGNAGTNAAGVGLTSGAAFVLQFKGGKAYRGGHSRIYLPAQTTGNLADENTWSAAWQSFVLNAWHAFISELSTGIPVAMGTVGQVIAHRYGRTADGSPGPPDSDLPSVPLTSPYTEPVTAYGANPAVGSQRRRNENTT